MESMHNEELLYYSLKRIASTIERIIDKSKNIELGGGSVVQRKNMFFLWTTLALH